MKNHPSFNPYRASFPLPTQSLCANEWSSIYSGFNPYRASFPLPTMDHNILNREVLVRFNPYRASFPLPTITNDLDPLWEELFQSLPGFFSSSDLLVSVLLLRIKLVSIPTGLLFLFRHDTFGRRGYDCQLFQSLPGFFSSSDHRNTDDAVSIDAGVSIPTGLLFLFRLRRSSVP